jgi:cell wall-associated NlpC family hydrolase
MFSTTVTTAGAVPSSKLEQARTVKNQIERLDARVELAAERYNAAQEKHSKLAAQKAKAAKRLKKVKKRMGVVQRHLSVRANSMYREGPMGFVTVLLGAESFEEFATTWDVLAEMNDDDAAAVAELRTLRAQAKAAHKEYSAKTKAAARQVTVMGANKRAIQSQLGQRKRKLAGLEREIAAIEAAEEAARSRRASSYVRGGSRRFPPPTRAARSEIISVARRYLGAPYRWGATGPNAFDCSGFTSFVYRQVGVRLPRVSRAQIGAGQRVNRSDLQPGDLVFFGSPIHHVGIYAGGGMYIHAPHTGSTVRYSPLNRGDYAGACRP